MVSVVLALILVTASDTFFAGVTNGHHNGSASRQRNRFDAAAEFSHQHRAQRRWFPDEREGKRPFFPMPHRRQHPAHNRPIGLIRFRFARRIPARPTRTHGIGSLRKYRCAGLGQVGRVRAFQI